MDTAVPLGCSTEVAGVIEPEEKSTEPTIGGCLAKGCGIVVLIYIGMFAVGVVLAVLEAIPPGIWIFMGLLCAIGVLLAVFGGPEGPPDG
jgi:hypothetical protein